MHRYLGLAAAALWLFQIVSGCVLVFGPEIDNATVAGAAVPVSVAALGARMRAIEQTGAKVSSMWVTNTAANRFDVFYTDAAGTGRAMRVDGGGRALRDGIEDAADNGGFFTALAMLHQSLAAGDVGKWLLTASGVVLFATLLMGLKLAWPFAGMWRRALLPARSSNPDTRRYALHRAAGLWTVLPALAVVIAGLALLHKEAIEAALGAERSMPAGAASGSGTTPAAALELALARFPGATITMIALPEKDAPWYRVRLRAADESPRLYGATTLYIGTGGEVLQTEAAIDASPARAFVDALYPFHSGRLGGLAGQMLLVLTGMSLGFVIVFGVRLWLARRRTRMQPAVPG